MAKTVRFTAFTSTPICCAASRSCAVARTAQPRLWFIAGSFAQCRIFSKPLALAIKAYETGLLPEVS